MKAPNNWRQVTLKQFIELQALPETTNDITKLINQVAVLTNYTPEVIREMNSNKLNKIGDRLKFLENLPKEKNIKSFYHKYRYYKRAELDHTTVAQVTEILTLNADEKNIGKKILNALAVIFYSGKKVEYDSDRYKETLKQLETLDFYTALNSTSFFLRGLTTYLPDALARFFQKLTPGQLEILTQEVGNLEKVNALNVYKRYTSGTTF